MRVLSLCPFSLRLRFPRMQVHIGVLNEHWTIGYPRIYPDFVPVNQLYVSYTKFVYPEKAYGF